MLALADQLLSTTEESKRVDIVIVDNLAMISMDQVLAQLPVLEMPSRYVVTILK